MVVVWGGGGGGVMTEKAEASHVLANILRTTPYVAYTAALTVGLVYPESGGLRLFGALVANEGLNHGLKALIVQILGKNELTARPKGARDCGIYPQHRPQVSYSSGMPSGHSQTACFLAGMLLQHGTPGPAGQLFVLGTAGGLTAHYTSACSRGL